MRMNGNLITVVKNKQLLRKGKPYKINGKE